MPKTMADNQKNESKSVSVKPHTRSAPELNAPSKVVSQKRSVLVEKVGFLVYTGAVHGKLDDALDEQGKHRAERHLKVAL